MIAAISWLGHWASWPPRSPWLSLILLTRGARATSQPVQHCFWRQPLQFSTHNHVEAFAFAHLKDVLNLRFISFVIQLIGLIIGVVLLISHFESEHHPGLWLDVSQIQQAASYLIWGAQFEFLALRSLSQTVRFFARKTMCAWRSQLPASTLHLPMF